MFPYLLPPLILPLQAPSKHPIRGQPQVLPFFPAAPARPAPPDDAYPKTPVKRKPLGEVNRRVSDEVARIEGKLKKC